MNLELDEDERAALGKLLLDAIERDAFSLSPRIKLLRGILAKFGVGQSPAMPYPAPKPSAGAGLGAGEEAAEVAPTPAR